MQSRVANEPTENTQEAEFRVRRARAEDLPFLRRMLVEAAYWRGGEVPADPAVALDRPDLRYLLTHWGRPGDLGCVAEAAGSSVGAAWFRLWTDQCHSYGFVDESTPELAIGVLPEQRGRGVGTALLEELLRLARAAAIPRLSLSVEVDNPALRLYRRLGFETHARVDGSWTMVRDLSGR